MQKHVVYRSQLEASQDQFWIDILSSPNMYYVWLTFFYIIILSLIYFYILKPLYSKFFHKKKKY